MSYKAWNAIIDRVGNFKMQRGITSFVNPFSMLMLMEQERVAKGVQHWYIDGISLVNKINKDLDKNINRFSFDDTSLAPVVFRYAKEQGLKIAIIGTKEEFIHKAVHNIEEKHGIKASYVRNGYFNNEAEREACYAELIREQVDLVICGMGAPYQELFLIELQARGWNGFGFTCGGYLHHVAGKENYYPAFFDKLNIRWVYRIIDEPKLFKRYFIDYPRFFIRFADFKKQLKKAA